MTRELTLGFSPCPNDTFIFYPLLHGLVETPGFSCLEQLKDVETLNSMAIRSELDISKLSYHAFGHIRNDYALLRSGSALGRGCGPLLVAAEPFDTGNLRKMTIAVPGMYTTATLLLKMFDPGVARLIAMPFNEIMDAVLNGSVDAGVIIHESRFTYHGFGLHPILDLGRWWEEETSLPIPLGGIAAKRSLGRGTIKSFESALKAGVDYSRANPRESARYIRTHAQEMSEAVCAAHIDLYVNDFSADLGDEGIKAINTLLNRAELEGLIPRSTMPLFAE